MNLVAQKHGDRCAVACYATVTGTSYNEALKVLHPEVDPETATSAHTSVENLLEALKRAGYRVNACLRRPLEELKTAILIVRYRIHQMMFMHVVVWDAERQEVLDPYEWRPRHEYETGLCLAFEVPKP